MEQRAIDLGTDEASPERDLIDSSKVIRYPQVVSVPPVQPKTEAGKEPRRRSKRFRTFIILELIALALFALVLMAGTSYQFTQPALTMPFAIAVLVTASAVAIIPVIFYGPIRQRYRYHRRSRRGY